MVCYNKNEEGKRDGSRIRERSDFRGRLLLQSKWTKESSFFESQEDSCIRLNRIEGQVRHIKGLIEKDTYCDDVITPEICYPSGF